MERIRFEQLVSEAMASLPDEFADRLDNIAIVVDHLPSAGQQRRARLRPGHTLLGLYEGVPRTRRSNYNMVLPDKITIFQKAIEAKCQREEDVREEIRRVVLHEIAHYFGIGDARLKQLGI